MLPRGCAEITARAALINNDIKPNVNINVNVVENLEYKRQCGVFSRLKSIRVFKQRSRQQAEIRCMAVRLFVSHTALSALILTHCAVISVL